MAQKSEAGCRTGCRGFWTDLPAAEDRRGNDSRRAFIQASPPTVGRLRGVRQSSAPLAIARVVAGVSGPLGAGSSGPLDGYWACRETAGRSSSGLSRNLAECRNSVQRLVHKRVRQSSVMDESIPNPLHLFHRERIAAARARSCGAPRAPRRSEAAECADSQSPRMAPSLGTRLPVVISASADQPRLPRSDRHAERSFVADCVSSVVVGACRRLPGRTARRCTVRGRSFTMARAPAGHAEDVAGRDRVSER